MAASFASRRDRMDMCNGPLLKKMLIYSLPIALSGLLQLFFNAADLIVVGRCCGSISVAAVGSTNVMISLLVNFFIGFSVGTGVTAAQAIGAGDEERTRRIVHTALPVSALFGLVLTAAGIAFSRRLLELMGTPQDVIELAAVYMRTYFFGTTGSLIYNFGASILRAAGDTERPLIFLAVSGALNVAMNVMFVLAFKLDVMGVALATAISQWVSAALVVSALLRRRDACRLIPARLRLDMPVFGKIMGVGFPAGIQNSMFCLSNVIVQTALNSFGSLVMSGASAADSLATFVWIPMNAVYQTAMYFTGQNYGAKKYSRISKILRLSLLTVFLVGLTLGHMCYLFAPQLLTLYIPNSPEAVQYGVMRIAVICLTYGICGLQDVMTGVIRGMGYSLVPMLISVFGICVLRIVWIYTVFQLPAFHTVSWLYFSYPLSWVITLIPQSVCFFLLFRRLKARGDECVAAPV